MREDIETLRIAATEHAAEVPDTSRLTTSDYCTERAKLIVADDASESVSQTEGGSKHATEFERQIEALGLTDDHERWVNSGELRKWVHKNKNSRFVPCWLLTVWEMNVYVGF